MEKNIKIAIENIKIAMSKVSEHTTTYRYLKLTLDNLIVISDLQY